MNIPSSHPVPRDSIPSAIETLVDTTSLLKAFTHRNKNQHASSHWFSHLSILRRNVSRLHSELAALQVEIRDHHPSAVQQQKKPQRNDDAKQTAKMKRAARAEARVVKLAAWMGSAVIPRSYVAFSQLVADNQHSALGLFLLSLLAKVNTLLASLDPPTEQEPQPSLPAVASQRPATARLSDHVPSSSLEDHPAHLGDKDRGEGVSRDHLPSKSNPVKDRRSATPGTRPGSLVFRPDTSPPPQDKEKALKDGKESNQGKKMKSGEAAKKDKDKKKNKRKVDEFSSLFGSL